MYNKTIIRFGICDIQNNQGRAQQSFFDNKNILK